MPILKITKFALMSKRFTSRAKTFSRASPKTWSNLRTSASPIRTNRRQRILARSTTRPNTVPRPGSTTVRIRATAVAAISIAETAAMIAAEIAVDAGVGAAGVEVAAVAMADVLEDPAAEICLRQNMHRRKEVTARVVATTKIVVIAAVMIGAVRVGTSVTIVLRAVATVSRARQVLQGRQRRNFSFPASRSRNSAIA